MVKDVSDRFALCFLLHTTQLITSLISDHIHLARLRLRTIPVSISTPAIPQ
jgi:hypothetical protein